MSLSHSGIWRILRPLGLSRLLASQRYVRYRERWKRYEKPGPGHQVQIDAKFIAPLEGSRRKHYQFTAIDDCTRLRVLRLYDRLGQKTAIAFVDHVLEKPPFRVERIQTDSGTEFGSAFHWHLQDKGHRAHLHQAVHPRWNGKAERSNRIDAEEFYRMLNGVVVDDAKVFLKLQEWEEFCNLDRPHGCAGRADPLRASASEDRGRQRHRPTSVAQS
ncbi:MAG: transposase family protein [Chloroflexota bacterium]|nr:transposase family protein [Chloroflexota bacterium]